MTSDFCGFKEFLAQAWLILNPYFGPYLTGFAGKTFLAATVVENCRKTGPTLFAFLSHTVSSSTTALSVLHSLIFQLTAYDGDFQAIICRCKLSDVQSKLEAAKELLKSLLTSSSTHIVVDGLDEIDGLEQLLLINTLISLLQDCKGVRILISSRTDSDLTRAMEGHAARIQVDSNNLQSIQMFVDYEVQRFFQSRKLDKPATVAIEKWLVPLATKSRGSQYAIPFELITDPV